MTPELEAKIAELAREIPDEELAGTGHNVSLYFDCKYDDPCADLRELLVDFARRAVEFALADAQKEIERLLENAKINNLSWSDMRDRAEAAEKEIERLLEENKNLAKDSYDRIASVTAKMVNALERAEAAERLLAERTPCPECGNSRRFVRCAGCGRLLPEPIPAPEEKS